jgi:hypothetical protein
MNIREYRKKGISVVEIIEDGVIIENTQNLLDIISDVSSKRIVVKRENICEDFFDLQTGLAGEILQKASNYRLCIGIIGDFSDIKSKSFQAFMYESNETRQIVFKSSIEEVVRAFCR